MYTVGTPILIGELLSVFFFYGLSGNCIFLLYIYTRSVDDMTEGRRIGHA